MIEDSTNNKENFSELSNQNISSFNNSKDEIMPLMEIEKKEQNYFQINGDNEFQKSKAQEFKLADGWIKETLEISKDLKINIFRNKELISFSPVFAEN